MTSCIVYIKLFSSIMPDLTRRSSAIWAPTPRRRPIWTHIVRTYVPASHEIQKTPNLRCSHVKIEIKKVNNLPSIFIEFKKFGFVNCSNSELTFHSRDQWRTLKHCSGQSFNSFRQFHFILGFHNLGLNETRVITLPGWHRGV